MAIPEYILNAAREYRAAHGGRESLYDAFIAGYKATKAPKSKFVSLTPEQEESFKVCWDAYGHKGDIAKSKVEWQKLTIFEVGTILPHIKAYVATRDKCYQKDFERYLKDKVYTTVIVSRNDVIYDPNQFANKEEYNPTTDGIFQWWDEKNKCLRISSNSIDTLNDGYSADNRPNGAMVKWQMYTWIWSVTTKTWNKQ